MSSLTQRIGVAALCSVAMLQMNAPRAHGQNPNFQVRPGLTLQQFAFNLETIGRAASTIPPYALGFNPYVPFGQPALSSFVNPYAGLYSQGAASAYSNPYNSGAGYGGYGGYGYGYPYYTDPYSGYLHGAADVINSQGRIMVSQQQAYQMREQVRQDMISTRRKAFDEYLYEREKMPTPEDDRERYMKQQLARSRNNPPLTEIWSGKALNDLLADLQKVAGRGDSASLRTFQIPLDEDALRRVNVSPSAGAGIGLLKDQGKLVWPVALSGPEFREQRERINTLAQEAVKQAEFNNQVDPGVIRQMSNDVDQLQAQLRRTGRDLPPSPYIDAKTFLQNLASSIAALQQRDVGNYFTGKYALKAKTVPELVKYMSDQGLRFSPAVPGEEGPYQALYQALVSYDLAAQPATAER